MELLGRLARDFNVRDPRKLYQIARREFPDRRRDHRGGSAYANPEHSVAMYHAGLRIPV